MRNLHITPIVVNLLLIVSLAIQPVAVCHASVACAPGSVNADSLTCLGCGNCDVSSAEDLCCCCSDPGGSGLEPSWKSDCCSSRHQTAATSDDDTDDDIAAAIDSAERLAGLRAVCMCDQSSQPLGDSAPRRTTSENRDVFSIGSRGPDNDVVNSGRDLAASSYTADVPVTTHFSQVVLCIWRL